MKKIMKSADNDKLKTFAPAIVLALVGLVITYQFVGPPPPRSLVLSAGSEGGSYAAYARRYQAMLAENGITLEVRASAGSLENLARLKAGEVDAAFVQTGVVSGDKDDAVLLSLGSLYLEPLWIVYRGETVTMLTQLAGRRVAVGAEGSGTNALVMQLLADNGVTGDAAELLPLASRDAAAALKDGTIDAACFVTSPTSPLLKELLAFGELKLMSFARANAVCNRHRFLSPLKLYRGVIDPAGDLPPVDHTLVGAAATLVVRESLHPALQDLLLDAADRIHGAGNWIEEPGDFPSPQFVEFALAEQADDFYTRGRSFLQRIFPFWAATLINRLKIMLIPLLTLLIPLIKLVPPLYQWRIRRRINRWYKALQELENAVDAGGVSKGAGELVKEIEHIEGEVARVKVPPSFGDNLYQLRFHTSIARKKLEALKRVVEMPEENASQ